MSYSKKPSVLKTVFHVVFGLLTCGLWWAALAIHRFQRRGVKPSILWTTFHLLLGVLTVGAWWIALAIYRFQGR